MFFTILHCFSRFFIEVYNNFISSLSNLSLCANSFFICILVQIRYGIYNSITLKPIALMQSLARSLSTYVDYITLKLCLCRFVLVLCLSTYVDYITLKPTPGDKWIDYGLSTYVDYITLKLIAIICNTYSSLSTYVDYITLKPVPRC